MKVKPIILAAGQGTRMRSKLPKVLHPIAGLPMVEHVIRLAKKSGDERPVVVIGHQGELLEAALKESGVDLVYQREQLGTAHAVKMAADHIREDQLVLILYGDTPLIQEATLEGFLNQHFRSERDLSVLTMKVPAPGGYGRIVRKEGLLWKIVEEKDADPEEKLIDEVNSGIYLVRGKLLKEALEKIDNQNRQREYYLTDLVEIFHREGYNIDAYCAENHEEFLGINDRVQLSLGEKILRERINRGWMLRGVTLTDPAATYIDSDVTIGIDTVVHPGTVLKGHTVIGENCTIGPRAVIEDSLVSDEVVIRESQVMASSIDSESTVGPFAYIRPGSRIGKKVKIGDFVEVKNSVIEDGAKVSHLTYVGDGDVGRNVNLGCGVVFVNYDGKEKHRTVVEADAFIGCNTNLIAPVTVRRGAYVAAGTTLTHEVPEDALAIGREKQRNIEGWVTRRRKK